MFTKVVGRTMATPDFGVRRPVISFSCRLLLIRTTLESVWAVSGSGTGIFGSMLASLRLYFMFVRLVDGI